MDSANIQSSTLNMEYRKVLRKRYNCQKHEKSKNLPEWKAPGIANAINEDLVGVMPALIRMFGK